MRYSVKQLTKLSGVSVRTLHWYDQIGLLKPDFYASNGYRYYAEKDLLLLQQILFFKELGFPLKEIQKLLDLDGFDQVKALQAHKVFLKNEIDRKNKLLETIDKTILHLKGTEKMTDKELYYGFDSARQKEYEQYLVKFYGHEAEQLLVESHKRTAKWDKDEWDDVKSKGDALHKALAVMIEQGLKPSSPEVQKLIYAHFEMQNRFYDLTKEVYIGLAKLYAEHPNFRKFFDVYHPDMVEFIGEAMRFYVAQNL